MADVKEKIRVGIAAMETRALQTLLCWAVSNFLALVRETLHQPAAARPLPATVHFIGPQRSSLETPSRPFDLPGARHDRSTRKELRVLHLKPALSFSFDMFAEPGWPILMRGFLQVVFLCDRQLFLTVKRRRTTFNVRVVI